MTHMSAKGMSNKARRGAQHAPRSRKDNDVKVDIEVDGDGAPAKGAHAQAASASAQAAPKPAASAANAATAASAGAKPQAKAADETPEQAHQRMVDAAIKAGEQAADDDLAQDVKALRTERDDLSRKLTDAADELEAAKAEAADATDRVTRLQADWDNYRRRTAQERLDEQARAAEKLVSSLLPVIDDLERAIAHAQGNAEKDANLQQFADGVEAVRVKLVGVLEHEGVEAIDPAGEPFQPLEHQAVGRVDDASVYDETVHDVYQKGYRMGGKVIRPAMVTVTYGGEKRPAPADDAADATSSPGTEGGAPADEGTSQPEDATK
jgi:molecular chaperone GrpE